MDIKKWLADMKAGDEVAYSVGAGYDFVFSKVAKVTASLVWVEGTDIQYRRSSGQQAGSLSAEHPSTMLPPEWVRRRGWED